MTGLSMLWGWPEETKHRYALVRVLAHAVLLAPLVCLFSGFASGAAAQGAAIEAENVITQPLADKLERVEIGRWSQDERGRTRYDFDEWTHIIDPVAQVEWRANSKRGYYSTHDLSIEQAGNAVQGLKPMDEQVIVGIHTSGLGNREVNGAMCNGAWHEIEHSGRGLTVRTEIEEWFTDDFGFPLRVKRTFRLRDPGTEETTELRNIVRMTDSDWEQRFRPDKDWKEVDGEVQRLNTSRLGFFASKAKIGATTRIGRRTDRRPRSSDPFEEMRLSGP